MSNMEQRLGPGMLYEGPSLEPGIVRTYPDGVMWLIKPDGTRCIIPCAGGGGGGAPVDAEYVVLALNGTLTSERVLTAGDALDLTDGGPGGTVLLDVLVDGTTIQVNGLNQLEVIGGSGAPTNAQYVTMALDASLTDERVLTAGFGLDLTDGGAGGTALLDVLVDGTSIGFNGSNQLEVLGGSLTTAVIKNPLTSIRNTITGTGNVIELPIVGEAAQTVPLFTVAESGIASPFFKIVPNGGLGGAVGIGAGTYNPNSYGFTELTQLVISRSQRDDAGGGVPIVPAAGTSVVPLAVDVQIAPTVNSTRNHVNMKGVFSLTGTASLTGTGRLIGTYQEASQRGTKAAASGAQIVALQGVFSSTATRAGSTGDVTTVAGITSESRVDGAGSVGDLFGVSAFTAVSTTAPVNRIRGISIVSSVGATGPTIAEMRALYAMNSTSGRVITTCSGLFVDTPTGTAFTTAHGVRIGTQVGSGTTVYGLLVEGGHNEMRAGIATAIPLTLQGFAAQSAQMFRIEDSALANLVGVSAAGVVEFGSALDTNLYRGGANQLKTDDDLAVGANWLVAAAGFINGVEIATPATPAANNGRLYFRDSGGGITQLIALWPSGNTTVIAEDF